MTFSKDFLDICNMNDMLPNEEAQGAGIEIVIIDIEVFARENRTPPLGKHYRVKIGGQYFVFHHHIVSGLELLEKAEKLPVECHALYQHFANGDFRHIRPHEQVNLAEHGTEHFVVKPPEVFHYLVNSDPETTEEKWLTPDQILERADIKPVKDYYLVAVEPDGRQISYQGKGHEPIEMKCPGLKFISVLHPVHPPKPLELIFIVNGTPKKLPVKQDEVLSVAVKLALKETGNEGRPLSDWEVKYQDKVLDITKTVAELKLPDCAELFVSLKAGHGGGLKYIL